MTEEMSNEVAIGTMNRTFSDDDLVGITDFDSAVRLAYDEYGEIEHAHEEMGNGFSVLSKEDKGQLVGIPLFLLEWSFNDGEIGKFVSIVAVARNEDGSSRKVIINDGSTGIMAQLERYSDKTGRKGGLMVKRGLRGSNYEYQPGKWATTYYLDTSA